MIDLDDETARNKQERVPVPIANDLLNDFENIFSFQQT
jgi:hypothetical protein